MIIQCGREFYMNTTIGFICGVENAWGQIKLCKECKEKESYLKLGKLKKEVKNG